MPGTLPRFCFRTSRPGPIVLAGGPALIVKPFALRSLENLRAHTVGIYREVTPIR